MNTTIIFTIKNRRISSDTKSIDLIGDNMDYTAVFDLDEDLAFERIKTARFIKDDAQEERILDDNNSCQIPPELLKKGYISVGVYTDEKSTTPCFLQINRSIRETDYPVKDPEPDVYRQLLEKIEKLKGLREIELRADEKNIQWRYVGEEEWKQLISFSDITVSPEEIKQAVKEYLKDNPLEETDPTVPDWAKEPQKPTYTAEEVGALPTSKLPEAIDVALAQAKASGEFNGKDGKDGAPGEKGDPGETTYVENPYDDTQLKNDIGQLKEDIVYKRNTRLIPVQFETVLGYYAYDGFVSGKKEWGARLMRVQCKKGDKYLYHGYCDNIYGVSFLDSEFGIIRQISVPENKEFEMDVNVIDNASYIDFYSASYNIKTYVMKYNREDTSNNDVGKIFIDASSQLSETDDKYFSPSSEELVYGADMKLKEITPENDTVFKFSFTQCQAATAYVDDFCIVTSDDYVNGTEVFKENIIVFVPKGKTLRINDFKSNVYVSKFEKLVPITEEYINDVVKASTGLPYIAVASSEAPTAIKSVCQYVCDGTNDEIEIQNAINSLASTGGKVFLTKGKFFISQPIETGNTLIELCGEGALLDLREDTLNSPDRGGTILQAVENTDLLHIGGAKGTTVHDIAFFGYGRNKVDNTSYGIRFTGYADTDRIYNCGFTNCAVAIGADIQTDVLYIHNLSVQRNKVGICLYRSDAEVHDCLFCENIGMENVSWDNKTYNINCADICVNDGKIYNNTFRRSGMCYDIFKVYGHESGLESDVVKPISSVVVRQRAYITGNNFFDCIYANCIRIMMKPDFLLIEGNSFTKWGHKDQTDDCRKSAICFDKGSVLGAIMNNRFYSDSNTQKFTDKYAIYECDIQYPNDYWQYSNTYANNFIGNLTADTENKCRIIGTASQNQFINNIVVNGN